METIRVLLHQGTIAIAFLMVSRGLKPFTNQSEMKCSLKISPMASGQWENMTVFCLNSEPFGTLLSMKGINLP